MTLAASPQRLHVREARRGPRKIAAERGHRRQGRETVHHPVLARGADPVLDPAPADLCAHLAAAGADGDRGDVGPGLRVASEAEDAPRPAPLRRCGQSREELVVAVQEGGAFGFQAGEDLRLGVGDRGQILEVGEVRRGDAGDDRGVRADHARQGIELAGPAHAQLEDAEGRLGGHARQAERHAPVVVVARRAGVGGGLARQRPPQRLLGAGLADASGDGDDLRAGPRPGGGGERAQRRRRVGDAQQRPRRR